MIILLDYIERRLQHILQYSRMHQTLVVEPDVDCSAATPSLQKPLLFGQLPALCLQSTDERRQCLPVALPLGFQMLDSQRRI